MPTDQREYAYRSTFSPKVALLLVGAIVIVAVIGGAVAGSILAALGTLLFYFLPDLLFLPFYAGRSTPAVVLSERELIVEPSTDTPARIALSGLTKCTYDNSTRVLTLIYKQGASRQVTLPRMPPPDLEQFLSDLRTRGVGT